MASDRYADVREFDDFIRSHADVADLDVFIMDVNGSTVGKRLPMAEARRLFEKGATLCASAHMLDCRGRGHNPAGIGGSDGDPDAIARPIAGTLCRVPWARLPTAQVTCSMQEPDSQAPPWFDPREILRGVIEECRAHGIRPHVACELEFYLIDPARSGQGQLQPAKLARTGAPPEGTIHMSLELMEDSSDFLSAVFASAKEQSLPLTASVCEYGISQYEINLRHQQDPLTAADHAVLLKRLVRGVARTRGIDATFMAKPFMDEPGSGLHVHVSLVDERGENRFGTAGGERLMRSAIAGMQGLMLDSMALFAPNFNSYRRYTGPFVPMSASWGRNNRGVAFRVPLSGSADARIEHRVAGADACPHLVLAAILSAILHGIRNELDPGEPAVGRPPRIPDAQLAGGLLAALDRLEASALLARYLPQRYLQAYAQLKRGEHRALFERILPRELDFYR